MRTPPLPTSSRFAVAVHILATLSVSPDRPVNSEQMARSASTHPVVIRRILSMLARAELTDTKLGLGGGAMLGRPASEITLLDVFRAVEECQLFAWHRTEPDRQCPIGRHIQKVLRPTTDAAQSALETELAKVNIADVAREILGLATGESTTAPPC